MHWHAGKRAIWLAADLTYWTWSEVNYSGIYLGVRRRDETRKCTRILRRKYTWEPRSANLSFLSILFRLFFIYLSIISPRISCAVSLSPILYSMYFFFSLLRDQYRIYGTLNNSARVGSVYVKVFGADDAMAFSFALPSWGILAQ